MAASNVVGYKHKSNNNKTRKSNQVVIFGTKITKIFELKCKINIDQKYIYAFAYR